MKGKTRYYFLTITIFISFVATTSIGQELILSEDFEGAWPGQWDVGDADNRNGRDYWGDSRIGAHGGNWSGWCADEGDHGDNQYDDYIEAYMAIGGNNALDLSEYENCFILYDIWWEMERNYDYFYVYARRPGDDWIRLRAYTGDSDGEWVPNQRADIPEIYWGHDRVELKFLFLSDESVHDYFGVFLDDIRLYGEAEEERLPDLVADRAVIGWMNGNDIEDLDNYNNIDIEAQRLWAVKLYYRNTGVSAEDVRFLLSVPDENFSVLSDQYEVPGNSSRWYARINFSNQHDIFSPGNHRLIWIIDPDDDVDESNEGNNRVELQYSVRDDGNDLPDLVIDRVTIGYMDGNEIVDLNDFNGIDIDEHERWALRIYYSNTGDVEARPVNFLTRVPDEDWIVESDDDRRIGPNSSRWFAWVLTNSHKIFSDGGHRIIWMIDPDNDVEESNEQNNGIDLRYSVGSQNISWSYDTEPSKFQLGQIYPNPFNAVTSISYTLPSSVFTSIDVYDISGGFVTNLLRGDEQAGHHTVTWNAGSLPAGIYLVKMEAGDFTAMQKVVLVK